MSTNFGLRLGGLTARDHGQLLLWVANAMSTIFSLLAGLVFGLGLLVSGMADPAKVLGFLDLAGAWDPSLAFVMGAAIGVPTVAFAAARKRSQSLLGEPVRWPNAPAIDRSLVFGNLLFSIGWGVTGFCPGPGLVALGMGESKALVFTAAILTGMIVFEGIERRKSQRAEPAI
jgi:hypothetical protein